MRIFVYDGRDFPDPDPSLTAEEVRQNMTGFFPELANADTTESKRGDDTVYTFKKRVGTKGHFDGVKSACTLGLCAAKKSKYDFRNNAFTDALRNGICPICGRLTERKYHI